MTDEEFTTKYEKGIKTLGRTISKLQELVTESFECCIENTPETMERMRILSYMEEALELLKNVGKEEPEDDKIGN